MDYHSKSEELHLFLEALTQRKCDESVFLDRYQATLLSPESLTPFSDIVGPSQNDTVIFSKSKPESKTSEEKVNVDDENFDSTMERIELSGAATDYSLCSNQQNGHTVPVTFHNIGQPLPSREVYLMNSAPHHEYQSHIHGQILNEAQYCSISPLSVSSARLIHSFYSLGTWKAKQPLPDVWTICEKNKQNIIALGSAYDVTNLVLSVMEIKENIPCSESQVSSVKNLSGDAFSEYVITTTATDLLSDMLVLQFFWNDTNISAFSPPPESSDAVLKISHTPGYLFSPVHSLFDELKSLYQFCQIAIGDEKWLSCDEENVLAANDKIVQSLKGFIEEMAHPMANSADVTVISPTCSHKVYEPRTDFDFVERLWMFCCSLTSYRELQLVFAELFKAVILGKIQPFIHKKSSSTLAELLRQVLVHREGIQDVAIKLQLLLSEARLVPCLIQVGLEKLKRDCLSFFVSAVTLSADHFEHFFSLSEHLTQMEQCIELCRLYSIVELDASIMKTLNLPLTVLSTFTKAVMEVYKRDTTFQPFSQSPIFCLSLPAYSPALKCVVALCSKLSPDTWRVTTQDTRGKQADSTAVPSKVHLKRSRPLLSFLQKTENLCDQCYTYEATCKLLPVH